MRGRIFRCIGAAAWILGAAPATADPGDVTADGVVDAADVLRMQQHLRDSAAWPLADAAAADVAPLVAGAPAPDGAVDAADLEVLLRVLDGDDLDGDALPPWFEVQAGTSPFERVTGGTGLPDRERDPDADGLENAAELALGTDPGDADTDDDNLADAFESSLCLDPADADSDGDGVGDDVDDALCVRSDPDVLVDWKLFQRGPANAARVPVPVRYRAPAGRRAELRVVAEAGGAPLPGFDFGDQMHALPPAPGPAGGYVELSLLYVPAGGNYRVEARLVDVGSGALLAASSIDEVAVGDVFLAGGQSNMAGWSLVLQPAEPPIDEVHTFGNDYVWRRAAEPMDGNAGIVDVVSAEFCCAAHSPMLTFAKTLFAWTGVPVAVVPASKGGSSIEAWARQVPAPAACEAFDRGTLYGSAAFRVCSQGFDHPIRGVIWYQGESNTGSTLPGASAAYLTKLTSLVANFRADLGNPGLFFASLQLATNTPQSLAQNWLGIQEVQRHYAATGIDTALVGTLDLPNDPFEGGLVHFTVVGYKEMGRRLGRHVARRAYALPAPVGPTLEAVEFPREGGTIERDRITVRYDQLVASGDPSLYRVEDATGQLAITGLAVAGSVVELALAAPATGTTVLSYGLSADRGASWIRSPDAPGEGGAPVKPGVALAFERIPVVDAP